MRVIVIPKQRRWAIKTKRQRHVCIQQYHTYMHVCVWMQIPAPVRLIMNNNGRGSCNYNGHSCDSSRDYYNRMIFIIIYDEYYRKYEYHYFGY